MLRCSHCGLQWWDFSSLDVTELYGPAYFKGSNGHGFDDYYALREAMEETGRRRLRRIETVLDLHGGRVLDVGCGPGFFLSVARSAGWVVQGIEISEAASAYAQQTLQVPVLRSPIERGLVPSSSFDLATMWDVIEHVPDPLRALRAAADALRIGGALVLTTGDVESLAAKLSGQRWHLYNLPEHLFFHTERSLRSLAERAGLHPVAVRREPMVISLSYAVERITRSYFGGHGRQLRRWVPNVLFPMSLHDVMTLYAVRAS